MIVVHTVDRPGEISAPSVAALPSSKKTGVGYAPARVLGPTMPVGSVCVVVKIVRQLPWNLPAPQPPVLTVGMPFAASKIGGFCPNFCAAMPIAVSAVARMWP
jgi:hypothetical protein